jgi:iron complex outermembrane receptor protein
MHTSPRFPLKSLAFHVAAASIACASLVPAAAVAQEGGSMLEEIVVTAQKREESLQDVAISVAAFSGRQMAELGLTHATDLVKQVPGLKVSGAGGGTVSAFSIRGVTQNDFASGQESPVAVYVDEAYISQSYVTSFSLFDLERAEVLRGPQGTLFGRNATGGLLQFVSRKPTQEAEGFVDLQLGEQGRQRAEAAIGGALGDAVSGRLAAVREKDDGLMENDIGPDINETDNYALRGQLLIEASPDVDVLLKAQYGKEDGTRGGYAHNVGLAGEFLDDPAATDFFGYRDADGDPFTGSQDFDAYYSAEVTDLLARVDWVLGDFTVTSVSNYQDIEHGYGEDADVSPNDIYNYEAANEVSQFSQEFRMSWDGESTRNVIGAYYLSIDGQHDTRQTGDAFFGTGVGYPAGTAELTLTDQETTTWAIFGQTDIDLAELWTLTLGGRINRDSKDFDFFSTDIYFLQGGDFGYQDSFSDTDWSAKAQLNYRPMEGWLLYAGVSRGIKSGGFNQPLFPIVAQDFPYEGETLLSFELGMKADLTDTVRLNASAFYYDYSDYQAYSFDGFATFLFNADAETLGAEFELVANPVEGLDIMLGVAWLDAEATDVPTTISATGKETPALSPDLSFNGLIRYEWPALGGSLHVQLDYAWQDDQNFNLIYTPVVEEKAYGVSNLRLGYSSPDDTWSAAVWVQNLGDEEYRTYGFDTTGYFGSTEDVPGLERWVGGGVTYRW